MISIIIIGVLIFAAYIYLTKNYSYWRDRNIPYLKPLPIFGNVLDIFLLKCNIGEQLAALYHRGNDKVLGIFMMSRPALLIRDPKLINELLVKNSEYFINKTLSRYVEDKNEVTLGLFSQRNDTWKASRKCVSPAFSSLKLKGVMPDIQYAGEEMVEYLIRRTKTDKVVDMRDVGMRYCVETASAFLFSEKADCFKSEHPVYKIIADRLFDYRFFDVGAPMALSFISPFLTKIFRMNFINISTILKFVNLLEGILEKRKKNNEEKKDYLEMLANGLKHYTGEGNKLCPAAEVFAGGFEPTSAIVDFGCYELVNNPKIQEKLRDEIKMVLKESAHTYFEKIEKMVYLDSFIKEVLRKYPIVPFLDRLCGKDFELKDPKLVIEKNVTIYVPVLAIHRNPEFYPDPDVFNPDRFSNHTSMDWSLYLPFSKGPRLCIAKRQAIIFVKSCFIYLLSNFDLKKCSRTPKEIKFNSKGFSLQIESELFLEVQPLEPCTIRVNFEE